MSSNKDLEVSNKVDFPCRGACFLTSFSRSKSKLDTEKVHKAPIPQEKNASKTLTQKKGTKCETATKPKFAKENSPKKSSPQKIKAGNAKRGVTDVLCTFPQELQVDASSNSRGMKSLLNSGYAQTPRQKLSSKIMASYDSVLMESHATLPSMRDAAGNLKDFGKTEDSDRQLDYDNNSDASIDCEEYDNFGNPQWMIDPHDIFFVAQRDNSSKVSRLGRGEYGPVYMGVWHEKDVAVKLSKQRPISLKAERLFQAKAAQLYQIKHPNIVKFHGACCWKGGKRSVTVSEYMEQGSLHLLMAKTHLHPQLKWTEAGRTIAVEIAQGMKYLHTLGLVHGRFKCSNVLLNREGIAKISYASLFHLISHCRPTNSLRRSAQSNSEVTNLAPEIAEGGQPTKESDIYALGVFLWRLLTFEQAGPKLRPLRTPLEAPSKVAWLVECCLDPIPDCRPSAKMAVSILQNTK